MVLSVMVGIALLYIPVGGWLGLAVKGVLFTLVYGTAVWTIGMNSYEKSLFMGPVMGILKHVKR